LRADYLLVGGGLAAASCAVALREGGAEGSIVVVGREPEAPYNRPPLSKDYLRGESSREQALVQPPSWWAANDVELLTRTSVMRIDPGERTARLSTKEDVSFGKALLATGANVRRLRVEGSDLEGIHYVRAFGNSDALAADSKDAERVVIVGGSYLGCELAASPTVWPKPRSSVTSSCMRIVQCLPSASSRIAACSFAEATRSPDSRVVKAACGRW